MLQNTQGNLLDECVKSTSPQESTLRQTVKWKHKTNLPQENTLCN